MNESQKMLNIIHNNCKKEQIRLAEIENKKNLQKRDIKTIVILLIALAISIGLIAIINKHNLQTCINNGGSELFCKYGGE